MVGGGVGFRDTPSQDAEPTPGPIIDIQGDSVFRRQYSVDEQMVVYNSILSTESRLLTSFREYHERYQEICGCYGHLAKLIDDQNEF